MVIQPWRSVRPRTSSRMVVRVLSSSAEKVDDAINLGGLKGSKGNQQYEIPAAANLHTYPNVVLYCNPFTVRIAVAELDV